VKTDRMLAVTCQESKVIACTAYNLKTVINRKARSLEIEVQLDCVVACSAS
jgi:hypothetical protein